VLLYFVTANPVNYACACGAGSENRRKALGKPTPERQNFSGGGPMNWKLGFFRLWIVASACWAAAVGWLFYVAVVAPRSLTAIQDACVEARRAEPALGSPFDCFAKGMNFDYVIPLGPLVAKYLALAAVPMLAAFLFWFVGVWVVAGFHQRRHRR
jgi:hypothetical protein